MTDKTKAIKTDVAEELTEDEAKEIAGGRSKTSAPSGTIYGQDNANAYTGAPTDPNASNRTS